MNEDGPSNPKAGERRLAAIVFTDVAGYSARMQRDETGTMALVRADFERMSILCAQHGGEVLKSMGDGLLLCFSSVVQAVACALQMQQEFAARAPDMLQHRIGIHLGDVFRDGGDVAGDGVNIAARLQTRARPGTICLSQSVHDAVKGKLPMQVESLGPQQFKNIGEPIQIYLAAPIGTPLSRKAMPARWGLVVALLAVLAGVPFFFWPKAPAAKLAPELAAAPSIAAVADKSIAVLPFTNMSDDKDSGYFADGVHEDLLTHLAKIASLKVISRTSVMQYRDTRKSIGQIGRELGVAYVLEGSVRRAGSKVRVTGQLIRAATDLHVWAQAYDGDLTDIFALQAQLATNIAAELKAVLTPQEKDLITVRQTASAEAYSLLLQARALRLGKSFLSEGTQESTQALLERAVSLDPTFVPGWTELARTHVADYFNGVGDGAAHLQSAKFAIDRALALAPDSPDVHQALGDYYLFGFRDYASATQHLEKLVALLPGSADARLSLGLVERRQGKWLEAVGQLRRARALDPRNLDITRILLTTLNWGGHYAEAEAIRQELVAAYPDNRYFAFTEARWQSLLTGNPQTVERWFASLAPDIRRSPEVVDYERGWAWERGDARRFLQLFGPGFPASGDPVSATDTEQCMALIVVGETGRARIMLEQNRKRLEEFTAADPSKVENWSNLGITLAMLGRFPEAIAAADHGVDLLPESADRINGLNATQDRAVVLAWAGRKEESLREIARLVRLPGGVKAEELATSLEWTPLHGDPRFEAICRDPANRAPKF